MEKIGKDCWDWDPWPFGTIPFCHPAPHPGKAKARSPVHVDLSFLLTTRTNSAWQRQERRCHLYIWLQYAWIFPAQLEEQCHSQLRKTLKKDGKKTPKNQPNAVTVCFLAKIHQSHWQEGSNCCWWCRATIGCETWDGESIWRNQAPHRPWRAHNLLPDMWRTRIVSSYVKLGYLAMQATRLLFGSLGPRNQTRDNGVWHDKRQKFHEISIWSPTLPKKKVMFQVIGFPTVGSFNGKNPAPNVALLPPDFLSFTSYHRGKGNVLSFWGFQLLILAYLSGILVILTMS